MSEFTPKPKTENALATREEPAPIQRRTRKRSRVELSATETADSIKAVTATVTAPGSAQGMALSAVDAFKSAAANAYTEGMKEAVPELFDFMDEVNAEVAEFMTNAINEAYQASEVA